MKIYKYHLRLNRFALKGPINNIPTLVKIMAWRRPADKPLSEPMLVIYRRLYASLGLNVGLNELVLIKIALFINCIYIYKETILTDWSLVIEPSTSPNELQQLSVSRRQTNLNFVHIFTMVTPGQLLPYLSGCYASLHSLKLFQYLYILRTKRSPDIPLWQLRASTEMYEQYSGLFLP